MAATNGTQAPVLTLMVGGPGSGKSTVVRRLYADATVVDMDAIKATHPEYDPKNPGAVHAWSQQVAIRQAFRLISEAQSFVFDSTGTNVERLMTFIAAAHATGMKVEAVLVTCSIQTALRRNALRARTVPDELVIEKHAMVSAAWASVHALADRALVVENEDAPAA